MTARSGAFLILKGAGLYCFIRALEALPFLPVLARPGASAGASLPIWLLGLIWPLALLILGAFFFFRTESFLSLMLPAEEVNDARLSSPHIQALAFSIIGVLLLAFAIPRMAGLAIDLSRTPQSVWSYVQSHPFLVVDPLFRLLLGVVLFFQASGLAALWHRLQGIQKAPPD